VAGRPVGLPRRRAAGPAHDPLFPPEWSDRIGEFFADATLTFLDQAGHFTPREAAGDFAAAVTAAVTRGGVG
jgi:pimeloyl-ACP methyl ester carboxylesterase